MGQDVYVGMFDGGAGPFKPFLQQTPFGSSRNVVVFIPKQSAVGIGMRGDNQRTKMLGDLLDEPSIAVAGIGIYFRSKAN